MMEKVPGHSGSLPAQTHPPDKTDSTHAAIARIHADVPCARCGYNVRTLAVDALCPECGAAVGDALRHGWLTLADVGWLWRVRSGVTLLLWGLLGAFLTYFGLIFAFLLATDFGQTEPTPFDLQFVIGVFGLGVGACWLMCVLRMTSPEPTEGAPRRTGLARTIIALSVAGLAPVPAMIIALPMIATDDPQMSVAFFLAVGIAYAGGLAGQIGLLLLMIYMRRIARRDVSPGLGRLMTTLIWGFLAMAVLGVGMGASVVLATVALGPAMATTATAPTTMAVTGGTASAPAWAASLPTTGPVAAAPMPPVVFGSAFYFIMLASVMLELFGLAWLIAGIVALFWFRRVLGRAMEGRGAYHGEPDFAR